MTKPYNFNENIEALLILEGKYCQILCITISLVLSLKAIAKKVSSAVFFFRKGHFELVKYLTRACLVMFSGQKIAFKISTSLDIVVFRYFNKYETNFRKCYLHILDQK